MSDQGFATRPLSSSGLCFAFGEPRVSGCIRLRPEDFRVDELAAVTPDGDGEHLLLQIRKCNTNTDWAAGRLAQALGVPRRDVSYAGRKDRHALTTQWFSVRLPAGEPADWREQLPAELEVMTARRHRRKLRRGALAGNRFVIVLRNLEGEIDSIESRARHIRSEGVPNYFGEQRFGHGGGNLDAAAAMFARSRRRVKRDRRAMLISAARSHIFNEVLTRRVADASWNQLLAGDVAGLAGSHSVFAVAEVDETLRTRVAGHDVHPTGPLWGQGDSMTSGVVSDLEAHVAARNQALAEGLEKAGVAQARRSLRLSVPDLEVDLDGNSAELRFSLVPGGYATVVLRELIKYEDASRRAPRPAMESVT